MALAVFMADGQLVSDFAKWTFESLRDAALPPIYFFGMECNDDGYKRLDRADEYLGADDEEPFACHYEAFTKVLPSLARHLLPTARQFNDTDFTSERYKTSSKLPSAAVA